MFQRFTKESLELVPLSQALQGLSDTAKLFLAAHHPQALGPLVKLSELFGSPVLFLVRSNMAMAVSSWGCNLKGR